MIIPIIAIVMIFSIPLAAIIGGYYIKLQQMKMENGGDHETIKDLRKEVGHLMAENDEIKDRLRNLEYLMTDESRKIDFDYEKEQVKLDNDTNKFNL